MTTCKACGVAFQFTEAEQARYAKSGFAPPKRCRACRVARRAKHAAEEGKVAGAPGVKPATAPAPPGVKPAGGTRPGAEARVSQSSDRLEPVFDDPGDVDALLDESGALDLPDVPRSPPVPDVPADDDDEPDVPGARGSEPASASASGRRASASGRQPKVEHDVLCAACGALTRVPFKPTTKRPVYCDTCFEYR